MQREDVASVKIFPLSESTSKTVAMVQVNFAIGMSVSGFRLINGSQGVFLSSRRKSPTSDKYFDQIWFANIEDKELLNEIVLEQWESMQHTQQRSQNEKGSAAPAKKKIAVKKQWIEKDEELEEESPF